MKTSTSILASLILLGIPVTHALSADPEGGPIFEPFDPQQLITTWRNLANEQVMFPLVIKDIPAAIDPEHQLFLDNALIAASNKVTRQVHQPSRYQGNPVLVPPKDKFNHVVVKHVLQFDESPRFRMWYASWDDWKTLPNGQQIRFANSYATSEDGKSWDRPDLGLHTVKGLAGPKNSCFRTV